MLVNFFEKHVDKGKLLYGFEDFNTDFFKTEDYKKILIDFITNEHKHEDEFDFPYRSSSHIKNEAKKQIAAAFNDMDRTIPIVQNNIDLIADFFAESGKIDKDSIDDFIKYIQKSANYDDIFNLPVHMQGGSVRNGQIESLVFYLEDDIKISEFPNLYTCIEMLAYWDDLTISHLVHEFIHGLTNRHRGIIKDGMLNETLPIFMELVTALNVDESKTLLDTEIKYRLLSTKYMLLDSLKKDFIEEDITCERGYFISALNAFSLFDSYIKASDKARKSMLEEIKKTLVGERCLEDTLKALDASKEEGCEVVRSHIKRLL